MFMDFALRANDFSNFYPAKVKFQCQFPWDQIFKLPAESWEEIEASEGKTNLLDSTRSENSILARSDVKTKG